MKIYHKTSYATIFFFYLFVGFFPMSASAASSFFISPILIQSRLSPAQVSKKIYVTNKSDQKITFDIKIVPFQQSNDFHATTILDSVTLDSFYSHVSTIIDGNLSHSFSLFPYQTKNVTVVLPSSTLATNNNYYFCILFISKYGVQSLIKQDANVNAYIFSHVAVGTIFLVGSNTDKPSFKVDSFEMPSIVFGANAKGNFYFSNNGHTYDALTIISRRINIFGQTTILDKHNYYLLPSIRRVIQINDINDFWYIGPERISLILYDKRAQKLSEVTKNIFVFPLFTASTLISIVIAVFLIWLKLKNRLRKMPTEENMSA